ncbi:transporter [Vulcanisaeta moutnovskia 768-28]|uniref:Transporter n=1 Tax=Vulcanisaeta moutnovskia (strain 768-28) TaxID=985053 RepID=F0QWB7_VULM7|nr:DMT family transporter [Vulcanisaeta moutnovskia]ADY02212.1 transporter [Vulcanisaeta moutnovskia 768-28]
MNNKLRGYLAMLGVLAAWGSSYSISKVAMYYMSPFVLTMYRFGFGGLLLYLIGRGLVINRRYVINALLNGALFVVFLNLAIKYSSNPALVSVLVYTQPIFVLILSIALHGEKPTVLQVVGIIMAFSGLLIAVGVYSFDIGDAIAILGGFIWALGTHYYRRNLVHEDLIRLNASMAVISALIAAPTLIINPHMELTLNAVAWGIIVALVAQVMGFLLWFLGVKDLGPVTASSISILVPASAYLFALLILGKVPTEMEVIGSAITLTGVLISQLRI